MASSPMQRHGSCPTAIVAVTRSVRGSILEMELPELFNTQTEPKPIPGQSGPPDTGILEMIVRDSKGFRLAIRSAILGSEVPGGFG